MNSVLFAGKRILLLLAFLMVLPIPVAEASFRLEYAEGVEPQDGIRAATTQTVPQAALRQQGYPLIRGSVQVQQAPVYRNTGRINWDRLARCESGGDWNINTGNGYYGGVQMTHGNWLNHRPPGAPAYAHQASKAQQIHAAEGILREQGRGAWPPLGRAECN